jgi:serine O-acetyltransferase
MSIQERLVYVQRRRWIGRPASTALRILGINIPRETEIGSGIRLPHGAVGLVVHERAVIGNNVKLYQGVTIGRADTHLPSSKTGMGGTVRVHDDALIGAGAVVLFRSGQTVEIGKGAVIGANAVVLGDVGDGEIWAGNPARLVGKVDE